MEKCKIEVPKVWVLNTVPSMSIPFLYSVTLLYCSYKLSCYKREWGQQQPLPALGSWSHKAEPVFFGRFPLLTLERALELQAVRVPHSGHTSGIVAHI